MATPEELERIEMMLRQILSYLRRLRRGVERTLEYVKRIQEKEIYPTAEEELFEEEEEII